MRILVTGGAGFIGLHVVDALIWEGHEVAVLDNLSTGKKENLNSSSKFYNVDITNFEGVEKVFKEFKPEIVYHLAAQIDVRKSVSDPIFDGKVNVLGSVNLFKLAHEYGVKRVIFSSTGGALYGEPAKLPATEDTPIEPLSPYGVSKYCGELYLNYFKRLYGGDDVSSFSSACNEKDEKLSQGLGFERVILRYANVYGPRQDPLGEAGVIAIFIGKILKGERPIIYGDGTQTRDYIFVEDVVRANLLALTGAEGTYNIGTGIETSVNELIQILRDVFQMNIEPIYAEERKGEVKRIALDSSYAKKVLGFEPKYSLLEGIRKTVEWFKAHMEYLR